jgi:hypothetical protein
MTPGLELAFELTAQLEDAIDIGTTPLGFRRIIPILGGQFDGPGIRGSLLPGGADWQIIRPDYVTELHAHYILNTDDGVLIQVRVRGLRHGKSLALARIAAGEDVDPSEYYFRAAPVFEAPSGPYDWLNRSLFVGVGSRQRSSVTIAFYRLL